MKKLLTILGLTTLTISPAITLVSCGDPKPNNDNNNNFSSHWLNLEGISQNDLTRRMGVIQDEIKLEFSEEETILDWTVEEFKRVNDKFGNKLFNEQITMFLNQVQIGLGISSQRDQIKIMIIKFEKINNNLNLFDEENLRYMTEIIGTLNSYTVLSSHWLDLANLSVEKLNEKLNQLTEDLKNKFTDNQLIEDWTEVGIANANNNLGNKLLNEQMTMMLNQMQVGLKIPDINYGIKTTISKIKVSNNKLNVLSGENNLYISNIMDTIKSESDHSEYWIDFESILQEEFIKKLNELAKDFNEKFADDEKISDWSKEVFKEKYDQLGKERFNIQITMLLNQMQIGLNVAEQKDEISNTIVKIKDANKGSGFFDLENNKYIDNIIGII